jgi:hypothetical protein
MTSPNRESPDAYRHSPSPISTSFIQHRWTIPCLGTILQTSSREKHIISDETTNGLIAQQHGGGGSSRLAHQRRRRCSQLQSGCPTLHGPPSRHLLIPATRLSLRASPACVRPFSSPLLRRLHNIFRRIHCLCSYFVTICFVIGILRCSQR